MHVPVNFDMDVLRTFVAGVDLGSFAKAAQRLGRSPSAISLQLRKLEDQVGQPLLRKKGRGLMLTEAGDVMIGYARRILELNDEARAALGNLQALEGWVRLGLPEDFAETWLPGLLARFGRAHPKVRVEARVDRGSALVDAVRSGTLDLALTWGRLGNPDCDLVETRQVVWIGPQSYRREQGEPCPLVVFDAPCAFRKAAIAALDGNGIDWRQTFASPSLAGLWAAATAGLGVTARTREGKPAHLYVLDPEEANLPKLETVALAIHTTPDRREPPVVELKTLILEAIATR